MLKKAPASQAANYELRGRVELARKNLPAARLAFEAALKAEPALFSAVRNLAAMDLQENKPQQAILRLQAAATADPRNPDAPMSLAQLQLQQGAPLADVKKLLGDAIKAAPTALEPRLALIDLLLRKRLFKEALAAASDAMAALPGDLGVLKAAGEAQVRGGDVEQAIKTYRRLASALPQSAQPLLGLASVYQASGQRAQAESTLKQALTVEPDNAAVQAALLDVWVGSGRQSEAQDYIRQLRQKNPDQPLPFLLDAVYQLRMKNTDAGLAVFREGVAKTDNSALAVEMHKALLKAGRAGEADTFGAAWMRKHPKDMAFTFQLAATDLARNEYGQAEEKLKHVVDTLPNQVMALNNLAWVLVKLGKPGAVGYAERAFNLLPDSPDVIDTLALALAAEKRYPAALEMQKRAIEAAPKDNGLHLNLAKLALQSGDKALAKQELQRLQALGAGFPEQAEVTQLLQKL
jgi:putative PEP-CTERM system TPR-repeat lipoprotein